MTEMAEPVPEKKVSVISDRDMVIARTKETGFFGYYTKTGASVKKGDILARVLRPSDGEILDEVKAPVDGILFFLYTEPLVYAKTAVIKMIPAGC